MPWIIDRRHSYVGFTVKHMVFTTVRGSFREYSGTIRLDPLDLTRSSFTGEIAVASIDTHDDERDRHLQSADFFDAARFPKMTFRSTAVAALGGNRFRVEGALTIRGIERNIVLEVRYAGEPLRDPWGNLRTGISATGRLKPSEFGVTWNKPLNGGKFLVGESVSLQIDVELMWQEEAVAA